MRGLLGVMSVWSSAQSLEVVPDVAAFGPLGQRSDVVYFVGRSAAADAVIVEGLLEGDVDKGDATKLLLAELKDKRSDVILSVAHPT